MGVGGCLQELAESSAEHASVQRLLDCLAFRAPPELDPAGPQPEPEFKVAAEAMGRGGRGGVTEGSGVGGIAAGPRSMVSGPAGPHRP